MFKALLNLFGGSAHQSAPHVPQQLPSRVTQRNLSRVELFFLSKFDAPLNPGEVSSYLAAILQHDPVKTARRLCDAGLIERASEILSLLASTKLTDLKGALRNVSLKVSGKKEELAHRLFESKPEVARQMIKGPYFVLSTEGRAHVEAFQATEDKAEEEFTAEWLRCFDRGDLKGALTAHRAYSDWQIKPPATFNEMGILLPDDRMVEMYQAIMEATPGILGNTSPANLLYLRRCAAWNWASAGKGGSLRFSVPSDFRCALEPQVAVRMVSFAAKHNVEMRSFKRLGVRKCEVLGSGGDSCKYCLSFAGRKFSVDRMPELPHPLCTHVMGCRCVAILDSI